MYVSWISFCGMLFLAGCYIFYNILLKIALRFAQDNLDVKKVLARELADYVFFPPKKHKIPHF
jgi:hypothetical protein